MSDPIVEEIRTTRERIAVTSGCDIHAIAEAARKRQQLSGVQTVSRPRRVPEPSPNNSLSTGGSTMSGMGSSSPA